MAFRAAESLQSSAVRTGLIAAAGGWQCLAERMFMTSASAWRFRRGPEAVTRPLLEDEDGSGSPPEPKADLVQKVLGPGIRSRAEILRDRLRQVTLQYQQDEGDTGSCAVQVARLTEHIKSLGEHMSVHRKDFSSRRGLERFINQRRKLLRYLRERDFDTYAALLPRLGLKDAYGKMDRLTLQIHNRSLLNASKRGKKGSK